jgi:hypothetical protein
MLEMASFLKYVDLYLTSKWSRFYVGHSVSARVDPSAVRSCRGQKSWVCQYACTSCIQPQHSRGYTQLTSYQGVLATRSKFRDGHVLFQDDVSTAI